jgi:hypothetical protein
MFNNDTVPVFQGIQFYSNQGKRVSLDQLSQKLPKIFSKNNANKVAKFESLNKQIPIDSLLSGKIFLPFPLKEYLLNFLKKMDDYYILQMTKNLIERIITNKNDEMNLQKVDFLIN